jgi:hypothetical protein
LAALVVTRLISTLILESSRLPVGAQVDANTVIAIWGVVIAVASLGVSAFVAWSTRRHNRLSVLIVVASDIFGVSGQQMLAALIAGERDPKVLAQIARAATRGKITALQEAFTGYFTGHHAFLGDHCGQHLPPRHAENVGADFYATRISPERRKRGHIRQLEALGYKVTLEPAASATAHPSRLR